MAAGDECCEKELGPAAVRLSASLGDEPTAVWLGRLLLGLLVLAEALALEPVDGILDVVARPQRFFDSVGRILVAKDVIYLPQLVLEVPVVRCGVAREGGNICLEGGGTNVLAGRRCAAATAAAVVVG